MYLSRANSVIGVYELSNGGISGTVEDIGLLLSVVLKKLHQELFLSSLGVNKSPICNSKLI